MSLMVFVSLWLRLHTSFRAILTRIQGINWAGCSCMQAHDQIASESVEQNSAQISMQSAALASWFHLLSVSAIVPPLSH